MNCLHTGHFAKNCKSVHRCKKCQRAHHTLLHVDDHRSVEPSPNASRGTTNHNSVATVSPTDSGTNATGLVSVSHTTTPLQSNTLLMTCRVKITAPDGISVEARALLDNASSASFVSERIAQLLRLPRFSQNITVSGIAGLQHKAPVQSVTSFSVSPVVHCSKELSVTAIIVPRVTCDLPLCPISHSLTWDHLSDLTLADPDFERPSKIDLLLGVDVFPDVLLHGRRSGLPGTPTAFETVFGWVLSGKIDSIQCSTQVATLHTMTDSGTDILHKFWELEEHPRDHTLLSHEEREVVKHFEANHYRKEDGRFVVPLPRNSSCGPIGESRTQAVRRFLSHLRSLYIPRTSSRPLRRSCLSTWPLVMQKLYLLTLSRNLLTKYFIFLCMLCIRSQAPLPKSGQSLMLRQSHLLAYH